MRRFPPTTLVSVVGRVDGYLLDGFLDHYSSLGVEEILLALQLGSERARKKEGELRGICAGRAEVVEIDRNPWRAETNGLLLKELRARSRAEWHVVADVDEFQYHASSIPERIARLELSLRSAATGLMWDRVTLNGELRHPRPTESLDEAYPVGAFMSPVVFDADPRKITLVRRDVALSSGQHHVLGDAGELLSEPPMPVHHFKWRGGCVAYLEERIEQFAGSRHREEMSVRDEALEVINRVDARGHFVGELPPAAYPRRTTVGRLPDDWMKISAPVWQYWQQDRWAGVNAWWEAKRPLSSRREL